MSAAFWLSLAGGLGAAGLMFVVAPAAAAFFSMPQLDEIVRVLAAMFLVQSLGTVAQGLLQRELRFRAVATAEGAGHVVGLAGVGIVAGLLGAGIWALVIGYVALGAVQAVVLVALRRHTVTARFGMNELRELVWFGGGLFGGRFFNYLALQGDNLVVARTLSAGALGAYGRAYQLIAMPAMLIGQVLDRVLFPLFAQVQDDRARLARDYHRAVALVLAITLPVSVVVVVAAEEIVAVVLGDGWGAVVTPLRILGIGVAARTAYKVSGTVSRAIGVVYARALREAGYAGLVVVGALVGQRWGISGVAVGVTVAIAAHHLMLAQLCLRSVAAGWAGFLGVHLRLAVVTAALAPGALAVRGVLSPWAPDLVVVAAVAAVTFGTVALLAVLAPELSETSHLRWLVQVVRRSVRAPGVAGAGAAGAGADVESTPVLS